ncbi:MAG: tRNA (adenosine(37)-N6)-threonylcarbamoyltransferase complex transferase subunit TsaD [bacterium]|nr:tRNA (adenosine(37)-N6)-threonylcarbamoyltransferase complex transferase subunit TsaD [bacterium]
MKILAIETSCDDTGIAILEIKGNKSPSLRENNSPSFNVLSNIVSSQIEVHKKYGGVYPALAKREHQKNLVPTLKKSLKEAGLLKIKSSKLKNKNHNAKLKTLKDILNREEFLCKKLISFFEKYEKPKTEGPDKGGIDLITVTNGPGLEPCLWVGVNFAKALSYFWDIPIIPVNHIESHILINFLPKINEIKSKNIFPAICLVVSGGHTQIILTEKIGKYKILGETRDDAAGECFDKCAKILGLGYPGGPIISKLATKSVGSLTPHRLPRPMINTKDYDFSFSGLKTAVLYHHKNQPGKIKKSKKYIQEMAAEIQQAIIDVLIKKTIKATKDYRAKTIILGGGVSANQELRKQFKNKLEKESSHVELFVPKPDLSTDNALMTAITGFFHRKQTKPWENIEAGGNLRLE